MAPKTNVQPAKLASVLAYIQKSGTTHSFKDLEKALPSVSSINGMQVKDYLSALSDENKICVEKIGSGNWYWSFPGEEKKSKEAELEKAMEERDRANDAVNEMKLHLQDAKTSRGNENIDDRENAMAEQTRFTHDIETLQEELAAHAENDPVEMARRHNELGEAKAKAESLTDHIVEMEQYMVAELGMDMEQMHLYKIEYYDKEYDEEEEGLKELREP